METIKKIGTILLASIAIIFGLTLFLGAVGAALSDGEEHTTVVDMTEPVETTPEQYSIGETIVTKDYKLTIETVNVLTSDNEYLGPEEGKEFVEVVLMFENTSDEDLGISSILLFAAYVDGFAVNEDFTARMLTDNQSLDGTIASEKKMRGSLCYQIPVDWSELEIQFGDNIWNDKNVTIVVNNPTNT